MLPKIGEKIIVQNIRHAYAFVSDVIFLQKEARYAIELSWKDLDGNIIGNSRVYDHDENKIWFKERLNS